MSSAVDERPTVRAVTASDWSLLQAVYLDMLLDAPDAFEETLAEVQGRSPAQWRALAEQCAGGAQMSAFLAEDGAGVCGFVRGDTSDPRTPPGTVLVSQLWAAPRQRGNGLGRDLMQAVTSWAEQRRAARISLGVAESNLGVQAFYQRLGYTDTGIRMPLLSNPSVRVIVMVKRLAATSAALI